MKLTTRKLKKLIQEELNEMMDPSGQDVLEPVQAKIQEALKSLYVLQGKFNFKNDPQTAEVLGTAIMAIEKADFDLRGLMGTRPDDELDIY
tara:strand:- start:963 stop:1235 length:273 start_codon:yes stop_codon:yes gene_type:complete